LSAHFEHTVAVTADEPWVLTARTEADGARAASDDARRERGGRLRAGAGPRVQ
jgi:hypothetical protein